MAFSSVTLQTASTAIAGQRVGVRIVIWNKHSAPIYFQAFGIVNTTDRFINQKAWIPANSSMYFDGAFTMPNKTVTVNAYSYYQDDTGAWRSDASASKEVVFKTGVVLLSKSERVVAVLIAEPTPTVAEVTLLDSRSVEVSILQELFLLASAERVVTLGAVGVILLDSKEQLVLPGDITGIVLLASAEQLVIPVDGLPPPPDGIGIPEGEIDWWLWGTVAAVAVVVVAAMVTR